MGIDGRCRRVEAEGIASVDVEVADLAVGGIYPYLVRPSVRD